MKMLVLAAILAALALPAHAQEASPPAQGRNAKNAAPAAQAQTPREKARLAKAQNKDAKCATPRQKKATAT